MTIRRKLIVLLLLISAVPVAAVTLLSLDKASAALRASTLSGLHAIAEFQRNAVLLYLDKLRSKTTDFASDGWIRDNLEKITSGDAHREYRLEGLVAHLADNKLPLDPGLAFVDVLDLNGTIVASSDPGRIGANEGAASHFQQGLRGIYASDRRRYTEHALELDIAVPLRSLDEKGATIGVLVSHFDATAVEKVLSTRHVHRDESRTIGETGESYLVDRDRVMITGSSQAPDAGFRQEVDTHPVRAMLAGRGTEIRGTWRNYRGRPVVGATEVVAFDDTTWVLVVEQDVDEAFAPMTELRRNFLAIGAAALALLVLAALLIAHRVAAPLARLTARIDEIAAGRLGATVEGIDSADEIGRLARAFNRMSGQLREAHDAMEEKNRSLHNISIRDGLTGLYNRRHLGEMLEYEFNRAVRYRLPLCCLLIDLDHFKAVNDTHGHPFGDYVLRRFGALLLKLIRNTDVAGRYGGEEFLVILPNTPLDQAPAVAARIRETVAAHTFRHRGAAHDLTVSIGVAGVSQDIANSDGLIAAADHALYDAKHGGRNQVKVA